jgi:voltage-gated potassium channel Kch
MTPLLMLLNEKFIQPQFGTTQKQERETDSIDEENEIIIAGFGRYGSTIGRFLQANGTQATYLDLDSTNVDLLRKLGLKVFYGDASRYDLLKAAGAKHAKFLIVAVNDSEKSIEIIETAQKHFPNLKIVAKASEWPQYYELLDKNIEGVYRDFSDTALRIGADVLGELGHRKYQVQRALIKFRKHDEDHLLELSQLRHEKKIYIKQRKKVIEELEKMMLDDIENEAKDKDMGWDNSSRKIDFGPIIKKLREEIKS